MIIQVYFPNRNQQPSTGDVQGQTRVQAGYKNNHNRNQNQNFQLKSTTFNWTLEKGKQKLENFKGKPGHKPGTRIIKIEIKTKLSNRNRQPLTGNVQGQSRAQAGYTWQE